MSKQEKKGLVPALRFPEFKDKWESNNFYRLLEEVLDFRGRTPKKLGMDWGGGNIVSLSANNIKNGYIDFDAECNLGSTALYQKWMGKVDLEKNDIVFTMEAPLGKALLVPDTQKYILSQRVVAFKTKENINNSFLIQLIWGQSFQKKIALLSTGSTAKGINQKTLKTVSINIPSEEKEQQKIADCLCSIDELITAQSQKLEALKAHKKGLMQQLFPAEGETMPKLRFPEFRDIGVWYVEELGGKTKKVGSGITPRGGDKNYKLEGRPFVRSQNVGWGVLILHNVAYIEEVVHATFSATEIKENDVLLNITGASIGRAALADMRIVGGNVNQHVCIIRTKSKELYPFFLCQFILSSNGQRQIDSFQAGGNREGLNFGQIRSFTIPLPPKVEEQIKVAACLSSIDELITVQSQKIEALKSYKKGLMQQLFPAVDEVSV